MLYGSIGQFCPRKNNIPKSTQFILYSETFTWHSQENSNWEVVFRWRQSVFDNMYAWKLSSVYYWCRKLGNHRKPVVLRVSKGVKEFHPWSVVLFLKRRAWVALPEPHHSLFLHCKKRENPLSPINHSRVISLLMAALIWKACVCTCMCV